MFSTKYQLSNFHVWLKKIHSDIIRLWYAVRNETRFTEKLTLAPGFRIKFRSKNIVCFEYNKLENV